MSDPPRPDLDQGVFETMLVLDGRPVELDAHLARLEASLTTLFPTHHHPDVPSLMHPYGRSSGSTSAAAALRVTVAPGPDARLEARVRQRQAPQTGRSSLCSITVPGGLGAHKWADRSLPDEAQAALPAGALPLIVDEDGAALEASRANLFAVRDETLFTPPLDGRILPGITRARVLALATEAGTAVEETSLSRDDLRAADEVFLTGSVRGIEWVESLDGTPLRSDGGIGDRLAGALRRAWVGAKAAV